MDTINTHMVRHGPVDNSAGVWYGRDVPFDLTSPTIIARLQSLAKLLPHDPATTLWLSSDYPRSESLARAVISLIPDEEQPELIIDPRFREQQYGLMTGMKGSDAKVDPRFRPYFQDMWNNAPPEGESLSMLQARVGGALEVVLGDIISSGRRIKDIVIIAHGGTNMAAFAHASGQRMIDIFEQKKMKLAPSFSYASALMLPYDAAQRKWLKAVEYKSGLPKYALS